MAGRRTPPLFDLLGRSAGQGVGLPTVGGQRTADGRIIAPPTPSPQNGNGEHANGNGARAPYAGGGILTADKPVVRVELKPYQPAPSHERIESADATGQAPHATPAPQRIYEPAPSSFWTEASAGRVMRVPTVLAYVIGCGVVGLLLATWFAAYKVGFTSGKDQMAQFVRAGAPPVVEPGALTSNSPPPAQPTRTAVDNPKVTPTKSVQPATQPQGAQPQGNLAPVMTAEQLIAAATPGATMTARGWIASDPRVTGEYYLELVTLTRADAAKTVVFLAERGRDAFALPVDSGSSGGNNGGPKYRVFAWPGLSQASYEGSAKGVVEKEVAGLGRVYTRDFKGPTDFRMPLWRKKT